MKGGSDADARFAPADWFGNSNFWPSHKAGADNTQILGETLSTEKDFVNKRLDAFCVAIGIVNPAEAS